MARGEKRRAIQKKRPRPKAIELLDERAMVAVVCRVLRIKQNEEKEERQARMCVYMLHFLIFIFPKKTFGFFRVENLAMPPYDWVLMEMKTV